MKFNFSSVSHSAPADPSNADNVKMLLLTFCTPNLPTT